MISEPEQRDLWRQHWNGKNLVVTKADASKPSSQAFQKGVEVFFEPGVWGGELHRFS